MTIEENKERELLIMSLISLQNSSELEVTILSNRFIDNFMPRAARDQLRGRILQMNRSWRQLPNHRRSFTLPRVRVAL